MFYDTIPERYSSVVDDVKKISSELKAKGEFQSFGPNQWIYPIDSVKDSAVRHVALLLDTALSLLTIYVLLEVSLDKVLTSKIKILQAITLANYGMLPGCFEMDQSDGEIRYRSVLKITESGIKANDIAQSIAGALSTSHRYAPAFQSIINLNTDPFAAIKKIEAKI